MGARPHRIVRCLTQAGIVRCLTRAGIVHCLSRAVLVAAVGWVLAPAASAQNLYLEGRFGGSAANSENDASVSGTFNIDGSESDDDRSIVGGGAIGFRFPLSWALDRELPRYVPDVQFRIEQELMAGREYDFFTTNGFRERQNDAEFRTDYEVTLTALTNVWVEASVYRQWSIYGGGGIGPAFIDADLRNGFAGLDGDEDDTVFAWQAGGGLEYSFDDTVTMGFGYRYLDLGDVDVPAEERNSQGDMNVDLDAHEFMLTLRVNFYYF